MQTGSPTRPTWPRGGSVFPGYPDHVDEAERRAWRVAAARQWQPPARDARPGARAGRPVHRRDPGLARSVPGQDRGLRRDRRGHEPAARRLVPRGAHRGRDRRRGSVRPVRARTLDEIRAPFEAGGGRVAGLELESAELFRLDNPYRHDDPAAFARAYVQSVSAWGGPLLLRAFAREGEAGRSRSSRRLPRRARGARRGGPRSLPLGLRRGPRHLPEGGPHRARAEGGEERPGASLTDLTTPSAWDRLPGLTSQAHVRAIDGGRPREAKGRQGAAPSRLLESL